MKNINLKFKILPILITGYWLLVTNGSAAQVTPEFLVSWRAFDYVPADFHGKIFPVSRTPVRISFDLIDNGRIADLSKNSISWFLDGELLRSGNGLKTAVFNSQDSDQQIRIRVANYRGADAEKIIIIPAVRPETVIDARFPSSEINIGQYRLEAKPFFFNVDLSGLSFSWFLNGELLKDAVSAPQFLDLNLESAGAPQRTNLSVSATVANPLNPLESASKLLNLTVK